MQIDTTIKNGFSTSASYNFTGMQNSKKYLNSFFLRNMFSIIVPNFSYLLQKLSPGAPFEVSRSNKSQLRTCKRWLFARVCFGPMKWQQIFIPTSHWFKTASEGEFHIRVVAP